jgi:hypothetical protein
LTTREIRDGLEREELEIGFTIEWDAEDERASSEEDM